MENLAHRKDGIYELSGPSTPQSPLVLDSPHSGRDYPADFHHNFDPDSLFLFEDRFVDLLFDDSAAKHQLYFLKALFPRTYIDPNRPEDDINPYMIDGVWPHKISMTSRTEAGHGLIRETLGPEQLPLYNRKLGVPEIRNRIETYYRPYHQTLTAILDHTYKAFGRYVYLDCHSMTANAADQFFPHVRPDFIIGDRDGTSCDINIRRSLQDSLQNMGYRVAVNLPYKGVELVRRYGDPARGRHSLQLEINKSLYINENGLLIDNKYNQLKNVLDKMIEGFKKAIPSTGH